MKAFQRGRRKRRRKQKPFVSYKISNAQIPENCTLTIGYFDGHRPDGLNRGHKVPTNLLDWNLPIA